MAESIRRWKLLVAKLKEARAAGKLGVIAASTGIAEYKLHDMAKYELGSDTTLPLTVSEMRNVWKYLEGSAHTRSEKP